MSIISDDLAHTEKHGAYFQSGLFGCVNIYFHPDLLLYGNEINNSPTFDKVFYFANR